MSREWDSASYHRLSSHQFEWGKKVLARVHLHGDEIAMDAGCGTGRLTAELLKRLPRGRVVAVDLSENMLRTARANLDSEFAGRAFCVRANLANLPFADAFDLIFSTAAFHWVTDHPRLFQNLFGALKPGGRLEAQCGGGPNLARLRQRAARLMAEPEYEPFFAGWPGPWEYADAETTARRLREAGFIEVETSIEGAQFRLSDPEEYRRYLETVTCHAHLARIPNGDLRQRFLRELAADPNFEMDYWRLNLRGRKPRN